VSSQHVMYQTRREFLHGLTLASTAGVLGLGPRAVTAEPALETTTIRLVKIPTICQAPQYVAEELLKAEGFTDVGYPLKAGHCYTTMVSGL
jgi:NitT/TauT family transport system substrate-binding protein